jgi:hypothetical protein
LVQLVAGVHVHVGKVEVDVKGVEAEALLKVRLENLYDIIDRALSTIDRNPEILEALLKTVDTVVDDIGQTAQTALGPGGAGTRALDQVGGAAKQAVGPGGAVTETGKEAGQAVDDTGKAVGGVAEQAGAGVGEAAGQVGQTGGQVTGQVGRATGQVQQTAGDATGSSQGADEDTEQGEASPRPAHNGQTKRGSKRGSKRGTRRSQSSDDDGNGDERGRLVRRAAQVGQVTQQALGRLAAGGTDRAAAEASEQVRQAASEAVQHVDQAAGGAVQHVGQAAEQAAQNLGQAAVEAGGKVTWTPKKTGKGEQEA